MNAQQALKLHGAIQRYYARGGALSIEFDVIKNYDASTSFNLHLTNEKTHRVRTLHYVTFADLIGAVEALSRSLT